MGVPVAFVIFLAVSQLHRLSRFFAYRRDFEAELPVEKSFACTLTRVPWRTNSIIVDLLKVSIHSLLQVDFIAVDCCCILGNVAQCVNSDSEASFAPNSLDTFHDPLHKHILLLESIFTRHRSF